MLDKEGVANIVTHTRMKFTYTEIIWPGTIYTTQIVSNITSFTADASEIWIYSRGGLKYTEAAEIIEI